MAQHHVFVHVTEKESFTTVSSSECHGHVIVWRRESFNYARVGGNGYGIRYAVWRARADVAEIFDRFH